MKKLAAKERKLVSKAISALLKPTYFNEIPICDIKKTLADHSLVLLQEDNTEWSGFLMGSNAHVLFTLGHKSTAVKQFEENVYQPLDNVGLLIAWYRDASRPRIEVTGYIS